MVLDRRGLLKGAAAGGTLAVSPLRSEAKAASPRKLKPLKVRIGHELQGVLDDKMASYLARFGVNGVGCAAVIRDPSRIYATVDELSRARELCERHGLTMDIAECALPTENVDTMAHPSIDLGESPDATVISKHSKFISKTVLRPVFLALNMRSPSWERCVAARCRGEAMPYIRPGSSPTLLRICR